MGSECGGCGQQDSCYGTQADGGGVQTWKIEVLVNVDVFSEGFDCPDVEFVQLARPTLSLAKYLQQVGRGLRRSEGKEACMLIDNVGLYRISGFLHSDGTGMLCSGDGWRERGVCPDG